MRMIETSTDLNRLLEMSRLTTVTGFLSGHARTSPRIKLAQLRHGNAFGRVCLVDHYGHSAGHALRMQTGKDGECQKDDA